MISFAAALEEDSVYGKTLLKAGAAQDKLGQEHLTFVMTATSHFRVACLLIQLFLETIQAQKVKETYLNKLDNILEDQQEYEYLKKKLENRRLDFDAKLNQVQKAKKEKPQLEEETRSAQSKYEETLTKLSNKMIEINTTEEEQLQGLLSMLEHQLTFHQNCVTILKSVCKELERYKLF